MTNIDKEKIKEMLSDVAELRDETRLKIHLGSKDLQDEWHELEKKWTKFSNDADLAKSEQNIKTAFGILGEELRVAYQRIKAAL